MGAFGFTRAKGRGVQRQCKYYSRTTVLYCGGARMHHSCSMSRKTCRPKCRFEQAPYRRLARLAGDGNPDIRLWDRDYSLGPGLDMVLNLGGYGPYGGRLGHKSSSLKSGPIQVEWLDSQFVPVGSLHCWNGPNLALDPNFLHMWRCSYRG